MVYMYSDQMLSLGTARAVSLFRSHAAFMRMLRFSSCVVNQLFEDVVFCYVAEINLSGNKLFVLYPLVCSFLRSCFTSSFILIKPEIRVGKWELFHCTQKRTHVVGKHNSLKLL
jgi:hypothetical protein